MNAGKTRQKKRDRQDKCTVQSPTHSTYLHETKALGAIQLILDNGDRDHAAVHPEHLLDVFLAHLRFVWVGEWVGLSFWKRGGGVEEEEEEKTYREGEVANEDRDSALGGTGIERVAVVADVLRDLLLQIIGVVLFLFVCCWKWVGGWMSERMGVKVSLCYQAEEWMG